MHKSQIIALYDQDQRKDVTYPDTRREVTATAVRHISISATGEGAIIYSRLDEANVEETIRQQVNYFESLSQPFEWKVYDYDRPADLKERLAAAGFIIEDAEAIMVLDLEAAPAILWQPVRYRVQRIVDPAKIADVLSVERQVWQEDVSALGEYLINPSW
jgi:hypothetical protein